MTNREFYKEQVLDIACNAKGSIVFDKKANKICRCCDITCRDCAFNTDGHGDCNQKRIEWFNAEYTEPCPFEKDELIEVSTDGIGWALRHFCSIENGEITCFIDGKTSEETSTAIGWRYYKKYGTLGGIIQEQKNGTC